MSRDVDRLKGDFDVRAWLDDVGVEYATGGDNVTRGWVGVRCIYCRDHANHMGVNLKRGNFYCWLCGAKGDAVRLVRDVEEVSFFAAVERLGQFQRIGAAEDDPDVGRPAPDSPLLPVGAERLGGELPQAVARYLERRRFPRGIVSEYGLMWCGAVAEYPLRLVVPVRVGGEIVTWQAADVTGRADAKYVSCREDRGLMNIKHVVYGIDDVSASPVVAVVEGVTDRWRVGRDRCVALFGKEASEEQVRMLKLGTRRDARFVVLLDADAGDHCRRLSHRLQVCGLSTSIYFMDEGDPADADASVIEEALR